MTNDAETFQEIIHVHRDHIVEEWIEEQRSAKTLRNDLIPEDRIRTLAVEFLNLFGEAVKSGHLDTLAGPAWDQVRHFLKNTSEKRVLAGYTPVEATSVIISLKKPLYHLARETLAGTIQEVDDAIWEMNGVLDRFGFFVMDNFISLKEAVIQRQKEEITELSTPVVQVWEGIVALPLIGTLDSRRTQEMMERLLNMIVKFDARVAIIDITGVAAVDTQVAQRLLKTVAAARLMGAECMISGISPDIAQTIVQLGVRVGDVKTEHRLYDAFRKALGFTGFSSPSRLN